MADKEYKESCGTIVEGLKSGEGLLYYAQAYYPIYMFRRLLFALIIVVCPGYPYLQLFLIIGVAIIPVSSYSH